MTLWRRFVDYFDGADPTLRLAGAVSFVVATNQPFYPLYVWWVAGASAAVPSMVTWISTPFFAAVPAAGRRSAGAGKILLLAAGIGNTAVCSLLLGAGSGVELFYLPCLMLAYALFEERRFRIAALAASLIVVAGVMTVVRSVDGPAYAPAGNAALVRLHALSVAGLMIVVAYRLWKDRRR